MDQIAGAVFKVFRVGEDGEQDRGVSGVSMCYRKPIILVSGARGGERVLLAGDILRRIQVLTGPFVFHCIGVFANWGSPASQVICSEKIKCGYSFQNIFVIFVSWTF